MNGTRFIRPFALALLLAAFSALLLSGCGTTEPSNASARPWNAPKGWENGLPTDINRGR